MAIVSFALFVDSPLEAYNDHTLPFPHVDIRWDHVYVQSFHSGLSSIDPLRILPLSPDLLGAPCWVEVAQYANVDVRDPVV